MKENSVVREGASGLANILQFPDGIIIFLKKLLWFLDMILWLKFDSNRLQIDAASNYVLLLHGKPKNLKDDKVITKITFIVKRSRAYIKIGGVGSMKETFSRFQAMEFI